MEAMLQWSGTSRQRQSHSGTPQAAAAAPAPSRDPHAGHARLHGHLLLLSSYHTLKPCTRMSGLGARNCNVEAIKISSADFLQAPVPTRLFAGSSPPPRLEDEGKEQPGACSPSQPATAQGRKGGGRSQSFLRTCIFR